MGHGGEFGGMPGHQVSSGASRRAPVPHVGLAVLGGSLIALGLWFLAKNVTLSVVRQLQDVLDTGRRFEVGSNLTRTATASLNSLKYVVAIAAASLLHVETWLYPASLVIMNGAVAVVLLWRRSDNPGRAGR